MRLKETMVLLAVALFFGACGGGDDLSPRERCVATEERIDVAAKECDPSFGSVNLSCNNFGTGSSCGAIDDYFACLAKVTCDNGSVVLGTGCSLGICE